MISALRLILYRLKRNKQASRIFKLMVGLLGLEFMNALLLKCLGIDNRATPWSFIQVLNAGFITPVFLSAFMTIIPILAIGFWLQAGIKRTIAYYLLLGWLAFIGLSSLGLYLFIIWDGLRITPNPVLIYRLFLQLPRDSVAFHHLFISLVSSFSLIFIALIFHVFSAKRNAKKVFGSAHFSNAFEIQRSGLFEKRGIVLGKAYGQLLRLSGYEGVLVVAPTGSGKTTAIAVPNLLEWSGSGVFNDLKGELYHLTASYRENVLNNECYLWAPADTTKQTKRYNPFFYVSQDPDLSIRDLQLIAQTLIPSTKLGDGFWYQSSREIFLTLALYLFETKGMATLSDIHDLSKQADFFEWLEHEIAMNEKIFSKPLKQNADAILGSDEKTQKNILKDFHSRMGLFNDPLVSFATSSNDFDLRKLRRKKMSIYLHIPDSDKERLSPILTLFWAQLIHVMSTHEPQRDEPYGVLALMDEFGNMARINKLKDGMSFLRSYRVRPVIIVQYLGQVISTYGREDAKGFLNSKVKIAFTLNDLDDAKFISACLGKSTVTVKTKTNSQGREHTSSNNVSFQSRPLMTPDEIMTMSSSQALILIEGAHPIKAKKHYWFQSLDYQVRLSSASTTENQTC